ncbi:MAG: hypothetical protein HY680_11260 [Chloroflexi bacterium]|nr:hypothetical protein [Chloroflexota bacterium]
MKVLERNTTRRWALMGVAATALAWAARPLWKSASAQNLPALVAARVGQVPTEPTDAAWAQAVPASIMMLPQTVALPRVKEAGAKNLTVRALYDAQRMAVLIEWPDVHQDADLGTVMQYRDGVAVMLPEDPSKGTPPITMGQGGNGVVIYHWKSDWQFGRLKDVDEAYPNMYADWYQFSGVEAGQMAEASDYLTKGRKEYLTAAAAGNHLADPQVQEKVGPVQKMRSEGFGTLEPHKTQDGAGKGAYQDGAWHILVSLPREQEKFTIREGAPLPVAFAAWDGARNERDGQKAYSLWTQASLGQPAAATPTPAGAGGGSPLAILGAVAGIIVVGAAAVLGFRALRGRRSGGG